MITAKELDLQNTIHIDDWLDFDSERCKDVDDNRAFTKHCMKLGLEAGFMFADSMGRLWCKGKDDKYYPYHLEYGKKKYGIRQAKKALN